MLGHVSSIPVTRNLNEKKEPGRGGTLARLDGYRWWSFLVHFCGWEGMDDIGASKGFSSTQITGIAQRSPTHPSPCVFREGIMIVFWRLWFPCGVMPETICFDTAGAAGE
ncbi:hypothetical protein Hypma_002408 [Hypsizygus marmoreus]|uniref:Uncharacterized protein n=1 Tax=Hypsizygus marmoreus TaxID=39966 RepID=A0A369J6Y5_HYPMA|nr:hypothetical protein Hypma_002408 [Hypsizygus marmoreus]